MVSSRSYGARRLATKDSSWRLPSYANGMNRPKPADRRMPKQTFNAHAQPRSRRREPRLARLVGPAQYILPKFLIDETRSFQPSVSRLFEYIGGMSSRVLHTKLICSKSSSVASSACTDEMMSFQSPRLNMPRATPVRSDQCRFPLSCNLSPPKFACSWNQGQQVSALLW